MAASTPHRLPVIFFLSLFFLLPVNLADNCGGTLSKDRGQISSPNFPNNYPASTQCMWEIRAPSARTNITLSFVESFNLEGSLPQCDTDKVEVYGKIFPESDWKSLGKFCEIFLPPTITFEGSQMLIQFISDQSKQYGGFSAEYSFTHACGGELFNDRGQITNPNFPNRYQPNSRCQWDIMAPRRALFTLNFTHLGIEGSIMAGCSRDRVDVLGLVSPEEEWTSLGKFCGADIPPPITFEGTKMRIYFATDSSDEYSGFSAEYIFSVIETTTSPTIATRSPREVLNDEISLAKEKLFNWFTGLGDNATQIRKWGHQLPRITVALFLADQEHFKRGNKTVGEMNYEITIQLLSKMIGGGNLKRRDLSLYIPALMVACVDPRNFYGRNLVAELRSDIESHNGTVSPFELLVLCNAGDAMNNRDVQRIATVFDSQHRPFWTDNQAMATIALACVSAHPGVTVDEKTLLDMAQELKKRQLRNGTFDNIKTTALVIQALTATQSLERDFDFLAAIRALLAAQREDGSVGSLLDSYYILPVLSRSSLLNITANHCKRSETSESEALNELQSTRGSRGSITYSVVIGTDVDLKRTWTLKIPVNSSLYNIIETVQKLDLRQRVEYNVIEGKPFVSSVMGIQDDVETGFYWFTYLRKHNSENSILVEDSPVDVNIEANQEIILWYKSGHWNKPSSSETLL